MCTCSVYLPPLAVQAIRVSLEEQRQRQEDEAKRAQQASLEGTGLQQEQQQEEPTGMDTGESVLASALSRELPSGSSITVADGPMVRESGRVMRWEGRGGEWESEVGSEGRGVGE